MSEEEKTEPLCDNCGEALSSFLQEMADHNAKVTVCPKCGKNHPFKPSDAVKTPAETSPAEQTI